MSKLLSQDEIDALLKGVQSGDIDASPKGKDPVAPDLKTFSFTGGEVRILEKMPGLQRIIETFVKLQKQSLCSVLMRLVRVSLKGVTSPRAGELIGSISSPATAALFTLEPLRGHGCIVVDNSTAFALIECFFGSSAIRPPKQARDLTAIEQRVLQRVVMLMLGDFEKAWQDVRSLKAECIAIESNPDRLVIWSATDVIIRIDLQIQIEDFSGRFSLCLPYAMISPLSEDLGPGVRAQDAQTDREWQNAVGRTLLDVPVEVAARISGKQISFHEVLGFDVGTVIGLNVSPEDEIPVMVEGRNKFMGIPGNSMGKQAIRITRIL